MDKILFGDGRQGEDITHIVQQFDKLPQSISVEDTVEIRGEIFIRETTFSQLQKVQPQARNPRNSAAGILRSKTSDLVMYLDYVFYDVYGAEFVNQTLSEKSTWLYLQKFPLHFYDLLEPQNEQELYDAICHLHKNCGDLPIDGLVIKANASHTRELLGETTHHPRWALAFKFKKTSVETVIKDILFQVGRTGNITPVAILEPVDIEGSTISRVTVHNISFLQSIDLRLGDVVRITKAGEIIPQIVDICKDQRDTRSKPLDIQKCLESQDIHVEKQENTWICVDRDEICIQQINYYAKTLKIRGLGPSLIRQLVKNRAVRDIDDLYDLTSTQLETYINIGPKTAKTVVENIANTRYCQLKDWIVACGFLGPQTAETLVNKVPIRSLSNLINCKENVADITENSGEIPQFSTNEFSIILEILGFSIYK